MLVARLRVITVFDHAGLPGRRWGLIAIAARPQWLGGDPLDELTDLDLLVVGSRGYGPLRAVLLGPAEKP